MENLRTNQILSKNLVLNIDLREEPEVRIREISPFLTSLKEAIGTLHVSVSLAYAENNQSKYINLPAFITETTEERILSVFFPDNVSVTIWKESAETDIDFLEYHIDKRTSIVTENSGINEYRYKPKESDFNIITIDLDLATPEDGIQSEALENSIYNQFKTLSSLEKPFIFKVVLGDTKEYCYCRYIENNTYSIEIRNQAIISFLKGSRLRFRYYQNKGEWIIRIYEDGYSLGRETIFLCENGDGLIFSPDNDMSHTYGIPGSMWEEFHKALSEKRFPAVFLKTPSSDLFCPVEYLFHKSTTDPEQPQGAMRISYVKGNEFWVETRHFNDIPTLGTYGEIEFQKFPFFPNPLTVRLSDRDENGVNSPAIQETLANEFQNVNYWEASFLLTLIDTDNTQYTLSIDHFKRNPDTGNFTVSARIPGDLQTSVGGKTLKITGTVTDGTTSVNIEVLPE